MNIITGYRGEPHITAQEDRDLNLGVVGNSLNDVYVLDVGQKLEADIVTANEVRIRDGIMVMQGCAASIDYGAYDSLEISNGALGMQRIDIIAAQYEKDADTSVENVSLVVVEGTPDAADPQPPTLTGGDLQGGDTFIQMPLYYVNLDGVSIDSIVAQFKMATNLDVCTLSEATQAKWNDIAGGASNDEIMDYIADHMQIRNALTEITYNTNVLTWQQCVRAQAGNIVSYQCSVLARSAISSNARIASGFTANTGEYSYSSNCIALDTSRNAYHIYLTNAGDVYCNESIPNAATLRFTLTYIIS